MNQISHPQIRHPGNTDLVSSLTLVIDSVRTTVPDHFGCLSGWQWDMLRGKLLRAGHVPDEVKILKLSDIQQGVDPKATLIVGFGEAVLNHYTGLKGIDKWHLSPLLTKDGVKFIPTYSFDRLQKQFELGLYVELALRRALEEMSSLSYGRAPERFHLNPSLEETHALLDHVAKQECVAVDVETGYGQINTVGFAWSQSDAIAINVLPDRCGEEAYFDLWKRIARIMEGPSRKIFQNFMYDTSYFSAYGIGTENLWHDTMHAMKVLWPELDMNLGNVGRIYTKRPYWKDDGKVESEEGKKKNWGNIRDWNRHYLYNCRDTTGTFEASVAQREDLKNRGLLGFYQDYLLRLSGPVREMCAEGIPLCVTTRAKLKTEVEQKVIELTARLEKETGIKLNPRSPKQVMEYLRGKGIVLPKKYDKEKGTYRETADATSLKKIHLKHPNMKELETLADIKSYDKALSSYINVDIRPDNHLSYSLNITGTETLRFAGNKDGWDRGFNIQTIPREGGDVSIKSMFLAPEGYTFIEVDLRQAESRFVAYDSADATLIEMLETNQDVHSYVANAILRALGKDAGGISKEEFKKTWRQLGKKAGHGANYAMKAGVFVETCFSDMGVVLRKEEAESILDAYHGVFPGIRRWHHSIRQELNLRRKLGAPSGWERYFYGRFGDDMFKEAYAWRPQHTIPWITNHLMLHLEEQRKLGNLDFKFLIQVHDALYLMAPLAKAEDVARVCLEHKRWHPEVTLPGGKMWIPTEVKIGERISEMKDWGE